MRIAPVSVCHQLSWNGRLLITFSPQTTASGFRGSPTEQMWRSVERSYRDGTSSPAFISIRMAVGAVYHTVTPYFWMIWYHALARKPPS